MDRNRVCTEYWDSRPYSRPQVQIPQPLHFKDNGANLHGLPGEQHNQEPHKGNLLSGGVESILKGLFKKASPAELHVLYSIINNDKPAADQGLLSQLLNEEIHTHPTWFIVGLTRVWVWTAMTGLTSVNSYVLACPCRGAYACILFNPSFFHIE